MKNLVTSIAFAVLLCSAPAQEKSAARTQIEYGIDADIAKVKLKPVDVTVEELLAIRDKFGPKMDFEKFHNRRFAPYETTVYRVAGKLTSIRIDKEGDINFLITGKTGAQVQVEIADLDESKSSPLFEKMRAVRELLESRYHPKTEATKQSDMVVVDGIGFFGSRRKPGDKPFGDSARLMPAIRFEVMPTIIDGVR